MASEWEGRRTHSDRCQWGSETVGRCDRGGSPTHDDKLADRGYPDSERHALHEVKKGSGYCESWQVGGNSGLKSGKGRVEGEVESCLLGHILQRTCNRDVVERDHDSGLKLSNAIAVSA